jgi:hypothetical protein
MPEPMLNAFDGLPGVALVPMPVERFGHQAELDDKVARQVLRLGVPPFLAPQADEGSFIAAHDDPSVGAADEEAPVQLNCSRLMSHFGVSFPLSNRDTFIYNR